MKIFMKKILYEYMYVYTSSAENYKVTSNINILFGKIENNTIVMIKKMFLTSSRVTRKFSTKSHFKQ